MRTSTWLPSPSVHRYQLAIVDEQVMHLPQGARPLHIAPTFLGVGDHATPRIDLWCHVDGDAPTVPHLFRICGTGQLADVDPAGHVGTVVFDHPGGRGVWHVFDLGEHPDG